MCNSVIFSAFTLKFVPFLTYLLDFSSQLSCQRAQKPSLDKVVALRFDFCNAEILRILRIRGLYYGSYF